MKILFTIAGLHPESGGPSRTVPALCNALLKTGAKVEIISHDYGTALGKPIALSSVPITFVSSNSLITRRLQWLPRFKTILRERCRNGGVQVIHDTGLWLSTNHAAATVSRELQLPRIVSPRGMLTQWSLRHKGWKKRIAWQLYQRRDLQSAQVLHATSAAEVQDFRAAGLNQPIAMIPNGVVLPDIQKSEDRSQKTEVRTVLFLSRIHPKKGLLNLVKAWAALTRNPEPGIRNGKEKWELLIVGTDETGHLSEVQKEVGRQHLENSIKFAGAVDGEAKWNLYQNADLFILPSHSENFGMVIAEALASGVPVIASRGTPWEELETHRCGWWVENHPENLADALRNAMSKTDEERVGMGKRGRELVEKKYGWEKVGEQMKSVYEWMVKKTPPPVCIIE